MKIYTITNPEKLKEIVPLMRGQHDRDRTAAFARVWSVAARKNPEKAQKVSVRIEVGRTASVYKIIGTEVTLLGTPMLKAIREWTQKGWHEA